MELVSFALALAATFAALILFVSIYLSARRVWLSRQRGSFDLAVRYPGGRWTVGVARYGSTQLDWFRVFHLSMKPAAVFERRLLFIVGRRAPGGSERAILADLVIVRCRYAETEVDLALSEQAYFGLSSWSEAAPPGGMNRIRR